MRSQPLECSRFERFGGAFSTRLEPFAKEATMKTVFADYNAMTDRGHVRLTCPGSEADLRDTHIGDWVWLSDTEIIVGARLETDPYWGLIGVPDWETLVALDDENDQDPVKLAAELEELSLKPTRSDEEEARTFQLLTLLETYGTDEMKRATPPGEFAARRADALQSMGKPELAAIEMEEANTVSSLK
jgi:hypothetical protein